MHNDDMQVLRDHANLVHNPRRDLMHHTLRMSPRRDYNRCSMCSRDRSRRT